MKSIYYLLIPVTILTSCAVPAPIVKLTPNTLQTKDYWNMGQQFVYTEDNNVWFDCAFNRFENGKLIFDVKVINQSDSAILVDPAFFQQNVYKNDSDLIALNWADNPEFVLNDLMMSQNIAAANAKNTRTLGICSLIIGGGALVAVAASQKDEEKRARTLDLISDATDIAVASAQVASDGADARAYENWTQRRSLSEIFLRKTTLPSGFYIDGEVHFPYNEKAKWYRFVLQAGKSKVDFLFKQTVVNPAPQNTTSNLY